MIEFPSIDPVAFSLGPIKIQWYGLMYLLGFAVAYGLSLRKARQPNSGWADEEVSDLIFYGAMGVVLGARVGYMFFYSFDSLLANPLSLLKVWEGGMSFHGGFLGVVLGFYLFSRKTGKHMFDIADFLAPAVPPGLAAGRFANFINGELWGRPSDVPWAMIFPNADNLTRHPSQLYQMALEGFLLFVLLQWFSMKPRPRYAVAAMFSLGYGIMRFIGEFTREPDAHLGTLFLGLSMGQLLSLPMAFAGAALLIYSYRLNQWPELPATEPPPSGVDGNTAGSKPSKKNQKSKGARRKKK